MNRIVSILFFLMLIGSGVAISSGSIYTGSLVLPNGATISSTPGAQVHIISNSTNTAAYNYVLEEQGGCGSSGWMNIVLNTVPKANIDCSGGYNTATGSGVFVNLTASGLAANQCVQTTSGGLLTTGGGAPCTGDIASVTGIAPIHVTTGASPVVSCSNCVATTPSPAATATGCSTFVVSGSWPYTYTENTTNCVPASQVANLGNSKVLCSDASTSSKINTCPGGNWPAAGNVTCSSTASQCVQGAPGPGVSPGPTWSPGMSCGANAVCASCNLDDGNCSNNVNTAAGCFAIENTQTSGQNGMMAYINRVGVSPTYTWIVFYNPAGTSISGPDTQQFVSNFICLGGP